MIALDASEGQSVRKGTAADLMGLSRRGGNRVKVMKV